MKRSSMKPRGTPLERKRKGKRARLTRELDQAWSQVVKARARGLCEKCGRPAVHAHHIYSRSSHRTRFLLANGVALCAKDHLFWAHRQPLEFADWIRSVRADDVALVEAERLKGPAKFSDADLAEKLAQLKEMLSEKDAA